MGSFVEMCLRECGEKLIRNPLLLNGREERASTGSMSMTTKTRVISSRTLYDRTSYLHPIDG
jgi:hypothetical protein